MLYLNLFHGRNTPDEQLTDWGFDGPIVGPLDYIQWTYGSIRLGTEPENPAATVEEADLPQTEGLVGPVDGKFYGDFGIMDQQDVVDHLLGPNATDRRRPIPLSEFKRLCSTSNSTHP